jgi:hypothetical protein
VKLLETIGLGDLCIVTSIVIGRFSQPPPKILKTHFMSQRQTHPISWSVRLDLASNATKLEDPNVKALLETSYL